MGGRKREKERRQGKGRMIERKRVEIEGGIKDGSWRFRRREMTFQEKQKRRNKKRRFQQKTT